MFCTSSLPPDQVEVGPGIDYALISDILHASDCHIIYQSALRGGHAPPTRVLNTVNQFDAPLGLLRTWNYPLACKYFSTAFISALAYK